MMQLRVGDSIEITTERLAYRGEARPPTTRVLLSFVPLAAPNERLRVRVTERKKNYARAVIESILEASPSRREPPCQYFGSRGGCQIQHINYRAQLESKVGFVRDALKRIGGVKWPHEIPIRHAQEFGYRSRAQIKVDNGSRRVGFNRPSSSEICDVETCSILVPELDGALQTIRREFGNNREYQSLNRSQIEIAAGDSGITSEPEMNGLAQDIQRKIRGTTYRFGATTFFQTNPWLLEELVGEAVNNESGDVALDLYAGVGLFSLQLAKRFNRVIGVEADQAAVEFARENVAANGLVNIEFHQSAVESWITQLLSSSRIRADLLLLDPPRGGASDALPG
jgi:23S rRNA (uracil1939-C5)-methyltransferase